MSSAPTTHADGIRDGRRVKTLVIGAGQTGLATAYYLTRAGHDCLVVDEHGRVGDQWRRRYDSLRLNTPAGRDALPGMPFPAPRHSFPTGREMGDYLEAYVRAHAIDVAHRTSVQRVERLPGGGYRVSCSTMVVDADQVVVATGGEHHPRVPGFASLLDPGIRQVHSGRYHGPSQLLPGPVLVVGASQSGADLALECAQAGHETWLSGTVKGEIPVDIDSRRARLAVPVLFFVATHVLTERTPIGRSMRPRIRAGGTPLIRVKRRHLDQAGVHRVESRTTGVLDGRPQLADGTVLEVANVLWCTGFEQDFSFIHPSVVDEGGWPRDEGGVVPDSPGLYFVGLLFQRGFYSMLIGGAGRDAKHIATHILAADAKRPAPSDRAVASTVEA
ncbi:MAG: flavin-containing monooxygenase [Dermatophilaceae bacterium]